jgi:peptidoglycan/xylan/chitin deacetylase (PgdA/CDA1 family)
VSRVVLHAVLVSDYQLDYLTSMTNEQIIAELGWSKKIIKDVIGVTPNFMRPPFGDIDDRVRNISMAMGLTPVMWTRISPTATFDTNDFTVAGGTTSVSQVLQSWEEIMGNASTLKTGKLVTQYAVLPMLTPRQASSYSSTTSLSRLSRSQRVTFCLTRSHARTRSWTSCLSRSV